MPKPNYENEWWGYIYDQMMTQGLQDWVDNNRRFYDTNLHSVTGPVLECACGTGIFLLHLLATGHDMYGFDISTPMLATLRNKAHAKSVRDIDRRISVQSFESFHFHQQFMAILIPTNSFAMLTTQEAQIQTLRNVYAHLAPGGKLLMDIRLLGMRSLVESPPVVEGQWHTWTHPKTGCPIRQRIVGRADFNHQLILDHCFIEYEGETEDFPMIRRWIFKEEFQLLLRLAGFEHWETYGSPGDALLEVGLDDVHSYWVAHKT